VGYRFNVVANRLMTALFIVSVENMINTRTGLLPDIAFTFNTSIQGWNVNNDSILWMKMENDNVQLLYMLAYALNRLKCSIL